MDLKDRYGLYASLPIDAIFDATYHHRWCQGLNLIHSSADVTVRGFVAHLSLDLKYFNHHKRTVEVTYTCPVDAKSAIYEFRAELNGRTIQAHCVEKKKAEQIYKDAVKQGHSAIIASEAEQSADVLQLSLGNLHQDQTALLHLEMVMELPVGTEGAVDFSLPSVFNPRYSPNFDAGSIPKSVVGTAEALQSHSYATIVKAKVIGNSVIECISSSSSSFKVVMNEEKNEAEMTEYVVDSAKKDWGFQIFYKNAYEPHVLKETGDRSSSGMMADDVIMLNLFPELSLDAFSPHNEIIFLVDCSGSMSGDKMKKTKSALLLFLKSLPHGSRFNIVCFGSNYDSLFKECGSERYTENNLKTALSLHGNIEANMGGTEIFNALKYIYSLEHTAGYVRQIMVLTDGQVWNVNEIINLISRNNKDTRVFSIGIGDGASTALVQGIAKAGLGRHEMVKSSDQLQMKVMGLIASMLQHNVTDVSVDIELDTPTKTSLIPSKPPIIFGGQHLLLYARVPAKSTVKRIRISGKIGEKVISYELKEEDCKQNHNTQFTLHRLAAKKQISDWQINMSGQYQEIEIIELSISSGVICRHTALVGFDQEGKSYKEEEDISLDAELCSESYYSPRCGTVQTISNCFAPKMKACKKKRRSGSSWMPFSQSIPDSIPNSNKDGRSTRSTKMPSVPSQSDEETELPDNEDEVVNIAMKQNFDCSWNFNDELKSLLKFSGDQLSKMKNLQKEFNLNDACFGTIVCLWWFREFQSDKKPLWNLVSIKGAMFLETNGIQAEDIIQKFISQL